MGKATNPRPKTGRRRNQPSAPRVIGANDNVQTANDNVAVVVRGVVLNKRQAREIEEAEAQLASPDIEARKAGRDLMAKVETEIDKEIAKSKRTDDEAEIAAIARSRGDQVIEPRDDGALEISRDGLETMRSAGSLSKHEYAAAMKYRADREMLDPEGGLTPPTLLRESKARGGGGDGYADKVAQSWDRVRATHLMIAGVDLSLDPNARPNMPSLPKGHPAMQAIYALEEIAGKGSNLRDLTSSGSVRARLSSALKTALASAAIVYGLD